MLTQPVARLRVAATPADRALAALVALYAARRDHRAARKALADYWAVHGREDGAVQTWERHDFSYCDNFGPRCAVCLASVPLHRAMISAAGRARH